MRNHWKIAIACFGFFLFNLENLKAQKAFKDRLTISEHALPSKTNFKDLKGASHDLKDYKGSFLIVKFWAPWCGSCSKELPQLDKVTEELTAKGINIFAIGQSLKSEDVKAFNDKQKLDALKLYVDDRSSMAHAFGVKHLPTTVFINKEGIEIARITGSLDWADSDMTNWLEQQK